MPVLVPVGTMRERKRDLTISLRWHPGQCALCFLLCRASLADSGPLNVGATELRRGEIWAVWRCGRFCGVSWRLVLAVKYGGPLERFSYWEVPLGESLLLCYSQLLLFKSRHAGEYFLKKYEGNSGRKCMFCFHIE